jgi:hypothetical protein
MEDKKQYHELEKEVKDWLDETDTFAFSLVELITMFVWHKESKNNNSSNDKSLKICPNCKTKKCQYFMENFKGSSYCKKCGHPKEDN